MLTKVISGGQTGADQAGLYAAKAFGLETGGWIPKGFRTDDGPKPELGELFGLKETPAYEYASRTSRNVHDADGTVLFGRLDSPGSKLTLKLCKDFRRPFIMNPNVRELVRWIQSCEISVLNVAGNRERTNKGIFENTKATLKEVFRSLGLKEVGV